MSLYGLKILKPPPREKKRKTLRRKRRNQNNEYQDANFESEEETKKISNKLIKRENNLSLSNYVINNLKTISRLSTKFRNKKEEKKKFLEDIKRYKDKSSNFYSKSKKDSEEDSNDKENEEYEE